LSDKKKLCLSRAVAAVATVAAVAVVHKIWGTCMGNKAKSLFYSVLFNKFHRITNLNAFLTTILYF
jgi:hypothetical protein